MLPIHGGGYWLILDTGKLKRAAAASDKLLNKTKIRIKLSFHYIIQHTTSCGRGSAGDTVQIGQHQYIISVTFRGLKKIISGLDHWSRPELIRSQSWHTGFINLRPPGARHWNLNGKYWINPLPVCMQPGGQGQDCPPSKVSVHILCTANTPSKSLATQLFKVEQKEEFSIVSSSAWADSSPTLSITGHVRLFRFFSDFLLKVMDGGSGPLPAAWLLPTWCQGGALNKTRSVVELETKVKRRFAKSLMTYASASQFHIYLLWGQHLFSIVS